MYNNMQMSKNIPKYIFALLAVLVLFNSCKKEYEKIEDIDEAKIQAYIQKNNVAAIKDPSGFYYQVLEQGTGEPMLNKDSLFYKLTIKSLSGNVYYTSPAFSVNGALLGYMTPAAYRISLYAINRGGKVRVIVPSHMAYGKNGDGIVPPNEVIIAELSTLPQTKLWQVDDELIQEFLVAKGITAIKHPSRIYYNISEEGTGNLINPLSTIKVKYTGRLLDGTKFDENSEYEIPIYNLIPGWTKILSGQRKGVKMRVFIPSDLGYGLVARTSIPASSILDFDIEVLDVTD